MKLILFIKMSLNSNAGKFVQYIYKNLCVKMYITTAVLLKSVTEKLQNVVKYIERLAKTKTHFRPLNLH